MTEPLRDLVATRLTALCLNRRGRPRGLTFDDHVVRGGLILDLAIGGALTLTDDAVEMDHQRAAAIGLADVAAQADEGDGSLQDWLDWGAPGFDEWVGRLVLAGVWQLRPWSPLRPFRSYDDGDPARTEADRARGRTGEPDADASQQTLAVLAVGKVSALSGKLGEPPSWVLAGLGEAQWAAELVVDRLTELRTQMRSNGHDLDGPAIGDPG
ncbi:hypothetical protein O2V63_01360 [Modestobacter sp. VKM Ac-2977]|uniref:hypothetical protein n=1 Tax=Modestobacter sp. VKM Ac-2977 TaxID=3004131 RepID=UPI0022AA4319|nr:hypothetical protein [Modestobacter sp. VKM Ac-2977]MCZ2818978.1 hypothetical protein [Modestobacter sp. VKM Ac-2977]